MTAQSKGCEGEKGNCFGWRFGVLVLLLVIVTRPQLQGWSHHHGIPGSTTQPYSLVIECVPQAARPVYHPLGCALLHSFYYRDTRYCSSQSLPHHLGVSIGAPILRHFHGGFVTYGRRVVPRLSRAPRVTRSTIRNTYKSLSYRADEIIRDSDFHDWLSHPFLCDALPHSP